MISGAVCSPVSLTAAFLVGVAGSMHCVAMCGGISGALSMRARRASTGRTWILTLMHQVGRVTSYTLAGAVVGACSGLLLAAFDENKIALGARIAAGTVLVAIAANILFKWTSLGMLERLGARLWRHLVPLGTRVSSQAKLGSLLLGMLWGWIPCGFVYSVLIFAALQGGALRGAAMMLCFGLGTLPALLAAGFLGSKIGALEAIKRLNGATGWVLLLFGVWTMLGPFAHHHH